MTKTHSLFLAYSIIIQGISITLFFLVTTYSKEPYDQSLLGHHRTTISSMKTFYKNKARICT